MKSFIVFYLFVLALFVLPAQAKVGELGALSIGSYQADATGTLTGPYVVGAPLAATQAYRNTSTQLQDSLAFTAQVFGPGYAQGLTQFFGRLRGLGPAGAQDSYALGNVVLPGPGNYLVQTAVYVYDRSLKDWLSGPTRTYTLVAVAPLPVTLLGFTVTAGADSVTCAWQTATERGNVGFYLEASTDGQQFAVRRFVAGHGTTGTVHYYQAREAAPTARTYYRLRQIDQDGQQHYSPVVSVGPALVQRGAGVYPNPAHDQATVPGAAGSTARLYDSTGHLNRQQLLDASEVLDLRGLRPGIYLLEVGGRRARLASF